MSTIEVYNPKFNDFHGAPMVTWREKPNASPRIALNLLEQYNRWKGNKSPKYDLPDVFWQSNGPAIVRALWFCDAKALVLDWMTDRKVTYCWFTKKPGTTGPDWYYVCSVSAEGGKLGAHSHVNVVLPSDEEVRFDFRHSQMLDWVKPEPEGSK